MIRLLWVTCASILIALLAIAAQAQVTKGKTRPALTKQIMSGLVKPTGSAIGKATRSPPADDAAWKELATSAALLNEATYILMDDERCPDAAWADAAKALRSASEKVLASIDAKDIKGVEGQIAKMNAACAACHRAHRK